MKEWEGERLLDQIELMISNWWIENVLLWFHSLVLTRLSGRHTCHDSFISAVLTLLFFSYRKPNWSARNTHNVMIVASTLFLFFFLIQLNMILKRGEKTWEFRRLIYDSCKIRSNQNRLKKREKICLAIHTPMQNRLRMSVDNKRLMK